MAESTDPSYIDYETFLSPDFSPYSFANSLVTATNNPTDTPLDLTTPLSRVLFDLQEIDTHIHTLTTKSALPLLTHTRDQTDAAARVLREVGDQVAALTAGYERLEREVLRKWEAAEEARVAAQKSWETVRLTRAVGRCLVLGRQLESQLAEVNGNGRGGSGTDSGSGSGSGTSSPSGSGGGREDYNALLRAANTIVMLRQMFSAIGPGEEGYGLDRVKVIRTLRSDLVIPAENTVKARAQQVISKFSVSSLLANGAGRGGGSGSQASTFKQMQDARSRAISAIMTLYMLSPVPKGGIPASEFQPELLLSTLHGYIHTALATSLQALSKALTMLSIMERTLYEVSGRCQDLVALETILESLRPPPHPLLSTGPPATQPAPNNKNNLLRPLLQSLDTSSLASYFWRSLASSLTSRVQDLVSRGGASSRNLKANRDRLRADIRECVFRGSQLPAGSALASGRGGQTGGADSVTVRNNSNNWEREAAVMVGAVVGPLGR
ncbi:putative Golgi transport complex component Cog5 [Thermoascus aurantiacus ATCC 26904]